MRGCPAASNSYARIGCFCGDLRRWKVVGSLVDSIWVDGWQNVGGWLVIQLEDGGHEVSLSDLGLAESVDKIGDGEFVFLWCSTGRHKGHLKVECLWMASVVRLGGLLVLFRSNISTV